MTDQHRDGSGESGRVAGIRASVVDVRARPLPPVERRLLAGEEREVVLEVASHLDERTVRTIALTPTDGLARGAPVVDTGGPIQVPVGRRGTHVGGERRPVGG